MLTYIALGIFILCFTLIVLDVFDKVLIALGGAVLMILLGILTPEQAIDSIEFDAILLLLPMMIVVSIAVKSGIFSWLSVKIAYLTKGNPLAIFLFFSLVTFICSAFLDNVTTVLLLVPLTVELVKGMGKDPKPYILAEALFANIGGTLTLIGDPSNIIIGAATGFNFMKFVSNLWIPVFSVVIFTLAVFIFINRKTLRPVSDSLVELTIANVIIKKISNKFLQTKIHKEFVIKVVVVILLTLAGFVLQGVIGLPTYVIAFTTALILAFITTKRVHIEDAVKEVEWSTLLFFAGLFVLVAGIEKTGLLMEVSEWIAGTTTNILYLSLILLWATGIVSMVLNNVPFITIMIPVIMGLQSQLVGTDSEILWWAMALGATLGGNGTMVGASANVVSVDIARKHGVNISFMDFTKFALPMTFGYLTICTIYLYFRIT